MKNIYRILTVLFVLFSQEAFSQVINIAADDITTCDAYMTDSGNGNTGYQPGERDTITICAMAPETVINLYWTSFNLGSGDVIRIFNGPDVNSPLIGQYLGDVLEMIDITSTNASGCLTIVWASDNTNEGTFAAVISCGIPCSKPIAKITSVSGSTELAEICLDEEIVFDGSSTIFQGTSVYQSVLWDFGDGTTNTTSWPTVTHSYSEPGAYKVNLTVTDNNGCTSQNAINYLVRVGTEPVLTTSTSDAYVCIGQEFVLDGSAQGVLWQNTSEIDFGGEIDIPDRPGECFDNTMEVIGYTPNQTIASVADIAGVTVNVEHAYIGDLKITIICPDGSSVVLMNNVGGGVGFGVPCDNDLLPNFVGIGWDYTWSPSATNPTIGVASGNNTYLTPVTSECGTSQNSITSGTYSSQNPWETLIGCPMNGEWTIEFCDDAASDNGFAFGWSILFSQEFHVEDLSFTPTFGAGCDSTFWSGQFITDNGGNCDIVTVTPQQAGAFVYTYNATDNHGCTFTENINVQVYPAPIVNAGEDFAYCGDQLPMIGTLENPQPSVQYTYAWDNAPILTSSNTASTNIIADAFPDSARFVFTVYPTTAENCVVRDTVWAFVPAYPPSALNDTIRVCLNETGILFSPAPENSPYSFDWSFSENNEDFVSLETFTPALEVNAPGFYKVAITEPGCGFTSETPYWVVYFPCEIRYANIFTPNGDGANDTFEIEGILEYPGSTLTVFNRWGQVVHESKDYKNAWGGGDAPEGVYYFIAEINKQAGKEPMAGYFQIVRK